MKIEDLIYDDPDLLESSIRSIGSNREFLERLNLADDWSAVILTCALIEASLTEAVCIKLAEDSIKEVIRSLPLNGRTSKVALASSLGIISKSQENFIKKFSEIRNQYAHGMKWFGSNLETFLATSKTADEYHKTLIFKDRTLASGQLVSFGSHPRMLILANALYLCFNVVGTASYDADSASQDYWDDRLD